MILLQFVNLQRFISDYKSYPREHQEVDESNNENRSALSFTAQGWTRIDSRIRKEICQKGYNHNVDGNKSF